MSAPVPQVWRLEVGRFSGNSQLLLNGELVYPSRIDICIEAGQRTILRLDWPVWGAGGTANRIPPVWHPRDQLIIVTRQEDGLFSTDERSQT